MTELQSSRGGGETISTEMDIVRRKLRELEEKISKIDRMDKLEARVKALEERLKKKP
jgi:hypothetical protein